MFNLATNNILRNITYLGLNHCFGPKVI